MSRLVLVVVLTVAGVVPLFAQQQPSADTEASTLLCHAMLFVASRDAPNCSSHRGAMLARATRGTLGGERAAHRRVRTNASPRP